MSEWYFINYDWIEFCARVYGCEVCKELTDERA